jgi:predicted amidohydrolase
MHKLNLATTQMDVVPAPRARRLARAERLIEGAAQAGAKLVVLPEVFNTGYAYDVENYRRAERLNGPTVTWMRTTAARLGVHLAGTLLLLDVDDVYNALLLVAPDGRLWRYDKSYPWGWERAYFRPGTGVTVAETDLGRVGMLICWDVAHPRLWRRYAGRVDLMVVSSSPPNFVDPVYRFPDGTSVTPAQMGPAFQFLLEDGVRAFTDDVVAQAAGLGVPVVNSSGAGRFESAIPRGRATLLAMLPLAPWLARYLPAADRLRASADMLPAARIVDAEGTLVAALAQEAGEAFAVGEVALTGPRAAPLMDAPSPGNLLLPYLISDLVLPSLMAPYYRAHLRQTYGPRMAPQDRATQRGRAALGLGALLSFGLGWWLGHRRGRRDDR